MKIEDFMFNVQEFRKFIRWLYATEETQMKRYLSKYQRLMKKSQQSNSNKFTGGKNKWKHKLKR